MIVTCDKCHAPYQVDESQVSEDGLGLECIACHQRFRVVRKSIFLVEPLQEGHHLKAVPASPATAEKADQATLPLPREEPKAPLGASLFSSISPAASPNDISHSQGLKNSGTNGDLLRRTSYPSMRRTLATEEDAKSGLLRPLLFLLLLIGSGVFVFQKFQPEKFQKAILHVDEGMQAVVGKMQPGTAVDSKAREIFLQGRAKMVLDEEADFLAAAEDFRQAISIDPRFAAAFGSLAEVSSELAEVYLSGGRQKEADAWMEETLRSSTRATTLDPFSVEGQLGLAAYDRLQGRFVEAQGKLDRIATQEPSLSAAFIAIGRNYLAKPGLEDMAREYFEKALKIDDVSIRGHRYLAVALERLGRHPEALAQWLRVLDFNAKHSVAKFESARLKTLLETATLTTGGKETAEKKTANTAAAQPVTSEPF